MNDNINEVLVGPAIKDFPLTVIIPSKDFIETIHTRSYRLKPGKFIIEFDGQSYDGIITLCQVEESSSWHVEFNFKPKKEYSDNDKAIRLIEIPVALFSKDIVYIKELFKKKST